MHFCLWNFWLYRGELPQLKGFFPKMHWVHFTLLEMHVFVFIAIYGKFFDYIIILIVKHLQMTVYT